MNTRCLALELLCACALLACSRARAPRAAIIPAASVVYRDPVTGRLGAPPPGLLIAPRTPRARPPLVDQPGPRGGRMILLDDRFHQYSAATVAPDGSARTTCEGRP